MGQASTLDGLLMRKTFQELSGGCNNLRQWLVESLIEEPRMAKKFSEQKAHAPSFFKKLSTISACSKIQVLA